MPQPYKPLEIEPKIQQFWLDNKIYNKIKKKNKNNEKFYYLDGPPYTSGRIHIGHAWGKALRDSIMRYLRAKGLDVFDRPGFDMHGLPTENKVAQKLNLTHKEDIENYGLKKFNNSCLQFCQQSMKEMITDFKRLGVWMNWSNPYLPITPEFIESEWWLVKQAHQKNRLYKGKKVMSWCPSCATSLSKHELEYKTVKDDSIYLRFKLKTGADKTDSDKDSHIPEYLIIWTTTPWTIPFNLAVMVNPEKEYVKAEVEWKGEKQRWIVAQLLVHPLLAGLLGLKYRIVGTFKGSQMEGWEYEHPFNHEIKDYEQLKQLHPKVHTVVLSEEYVETTAGSGLVHCAPGCGPEDYEVGYKNNLPAYNRIDEGGVFPEDFGKFSQWTAKKDDHKFREDLKEKRILIETSPVEHEYAHCWRCHNPVVFRATKQWFFRVEDLKDKMIELNKEVYWVPQAAFHAFDSWLKNLRDNGITRQRYWGTPLPVWECSNEECEEYTVIGSLDELKKKAGSLPKDESGQINLHKPWIDEMTFKCQKCGGEMKRNPDVLDVWIDAGTVSWSALDFPQKKDLFNHYFPADLILEGKDQIRGWFNLLLVAGMLGLEKHPYKAVYMHGFIADYEGKKMSKSQGNIVSPQEVLEKYGADTFRYYSIGSANPGVDMNFNWDDLKLKHRHLMVLWNLQNLLFSLCQQADLDPSQLSEEEIGPLGLEEKYILSRLHSTLLKVTKLFEAYKLDQVPAVIENLFLDLSRTYVQFVRTKTDGSLEEQRLVASTIYRVLFEVLKIFTPVVPFITEAIYQNLKERFELIEESISLYDWPKIEKGFIDENLEKQVGQLNQLLSSVALAREKIKLGVRWPLKKIVLETEDSHLVETIDLFTNLIKEKANVKELEVLPHFEESKKKVKADYKKIAPAFGETEAALIIAEIAKVSPETVIGHIKRDGSYTINAGGKSYQVKKEHLFFEDALPDNWDKVEVDGLKLNLYLDKTRTRMLKAEGFSRELMRKIQSLRKKAGLEKKDRIELIIKVPLEWKEYLDEFKEAVKEKVGAAKLSIVSEQPSAKEHSEEVSIKREKFGIYFDLR